MKYGMIAFWMCFVLMFAAYAVQYVFPSCGVISGWLGATVYLTVLRKVK